MFSKQRAYVPKDAPKPKVKVRTVTVEVPKPKSTANGSSLSRTPSRGFDPKSRPSVERSAASSRLSPTTSGIKRSADGRPRASDSPFASSADEHSYLAPPSARKRIRSPATDSDRVAFEPDDDSPDDDDWESRLKRRKPATRTDPDRKLRNVALTELAEGGYKDTGKKLKFVHAADVVSLAQGDEKCFPGAGPEDLVVELQYPGSLTRERYVYTTWLLVRTMLHQC